MAAWKDLTKHRKKHTSKTPTNSSVALQLNRPSFWRCEQLRQAAMWPQGTKTVNSSDFLSSMPWGIHFGCMQLKQLTWHSWNTAAFNCPLFSPHGTFFCSKLLRHFCTFRSIFGWQFTGVHSCCLIFHPVAIPAPSDTSGSLPGRTGRSMLPLGHAAPPRRILWQSSEHGVSYNRLNRPKKQKQRAWQHQRRHTDNRLQAKGTTIPPQFPMLERVAGQRWSCTPSRIMPIVLKALVHLISFVQSVGDTRMQGPKGTAPLQWVCSRYSKLQRLVHTMPESLRNFVRHLNRPEGTKTKAYRQRIFFV